MKKFLQVFLPALFLTILLFLVTSFTVSSGAGSKSDRVSLLEGKVDSLEVKVNSLEERVKRLEDKEYAFKIPKPYLRIPDGRIPPDWREHNFKGMPYYIVPLSTVKDNR